jgi:transcriptional regulator with XRE-family HTH domain
MNKDEKDCRTVLSRNIKRYRNRLGLSQLHLALELGISTTFLSDIETGKKWASPVTIVKFADAFNVKAYELLKPSDILPENYNNVIEKFAEDMHSAVEHIRNSFLQ